MAPFKWGTLLPFIDSSILAEEGKDVKVALLDSGVEFSHPALSRLKRAGRAFDGWHYGRQLSASRRGIHGYCTANGFVHFQGI